MANQIRLKRGSGSSPSTSDLVVGEVAVRTDTGQLFTKKDDGNIEEIGAQSGIADGSITNAKVASNAAIAGTKISPDFGSQDITTTGDIGVGTNAVLSINTLQFSNNSGGRIIFSDANNNPDYRIESSQGKFQIDPNNALNPIFKINTDGHVDINTNLDCGAGIDVTGDLTTTGDATIGGGDLTLQTTGAPALHLVDLNHNSDFTIRNFDGTLQFRDSTNSANRLTVASNGLVTVANDLTVTGDLKIDNINKSLQVGDVSNDNYLNLRQVSASSHVGFTFQHSNASVLENLQGSTNQYLVLGDNDNGNGGTIFGIGQTQGGNTYNYLTLSAAGNLNISNNITLGGTVDGVDIAALNTTVGTKLPLAGGTLTGNLTISHDHPRIIFNDTSNNPDYLIDVNAGHFLIYDSTNSANRLLINSDGHIDLLGNVDITNGLDVTGNITATGTITSTGLIMADNKSILLGDSDDFRIRHTGSHSEITDEGTGHLRLGGSQKVDIGNVDFSKLYFRGSDGGGVGLYHNGTLKFGTSSAGINVYGSISVTGTVDGRDVATDGTKLDGIESNATADQTASEILTLIKTVDGSGSGLDADLLDGISSASFLRSDAADTCSGKITFSDGIVLPTTGDGIKFGPGDAANDDAHIEWLGGSNTGYLRISTSDDSDSSGQNEYIEFGDYPTVNKGGTFTQHVRIARDRFLVRTGSNTISQADRLNIASDGKVDIYGNLEVGNFTRSTNGYGVGSTTVLSASRELQNVTLNSSSVTATTQSAGNNTTRIATTAFVSTAINNLINGAPAALDTLNELAAAMNDNASFSTTVTNSLATKMPLAGGEFTGNITFSGSQTVDGRDLSVDGSKLDGIESGATADQSASEILTLIKTVDGSGSGLDADLLDGYNQSDSASTNTIVRRNANGYIFSNYIHTTDNSVTSGVAEVMVKTTGGGDYHRSASAGAIRTFINVEDGATADQTASEILTLIKTVDGSGSGLDADTLDGANASVSASNSTIVQRHPSGYIFANYFNTTANDVSSGVTKIMVETGNDNYIRHGTAGAVRSFLNVADGATNVTNNNQLTNGAGYITSSGTSAGFSAGNASNLNSGTVAAARLPQQEHGTSIVGNFGQWQGHSTYSNFNTEPAYWGWNFIQGSTNAPNTTSSQWYRCRLSLGSEYGKGSDSGDYSLEMALPRYSHSAAGVLHIRTIEAGSEGSWTTVGNNASLITTGTLSTARLSASDVLTLIKTVDGAGSGLDADTLDGISSGSFLRSDASDSVTNYTHNIHFYSNTAINSASGNQASLEVFGNGGSGTDAFMSFHVSNDYACYLGLDGGTNKLSVGGWSMGAVSHAIYHEGNNPTFSQLGITASNINALGINATTLDSIDSGSFLRSDTADTASGDITFSGGGGAVTIAGSSDIRFTNGSWTGDTCKIQHHGSRLYIVGGSDGIRFREGGTDRWNIDGSGHFVPASNNTYNIGSSSLRVANLYVNDMHFSNKGKTNDVDGSWGDWTLQEGEEDIFMINNRSGKKFKIAMTPV